MEGLDSTEFIRPSYTTGQLVERGVYAAVGLFFLVLGLPALVLGRLVVVAIVCIAVGATLVRTYAFRTAGVLVRPNDDLFVVRGEMGGSRSIAWGSVVRFRLTDDHGAAVDLKDGSSITLSGFEKQGREPVERLNAILEGKRGAPVAPKERPQTRELIRGRSDTRVRKAARAIGTLVMLLCVVIVFVGVTNPADGGIATAIVFLLLGVAVALPAFVFPDAGVQVSDEVETFAICDRWWRTRRVAWSDVVRFRSDKALGTVVELRDGSLIRVFTGDPERTPGRQEAVDRLNAIADRRRGDN